MDLTGVYSSEAQAYSRGIELAVEELNTANPGSIESVTEDTEFSTKLAVTAAQRLIAQKKVTALLTMSATEQKSVALIAKNLKIPTVALWDSSPEIESIGEYSFGFGPWTPATGEKSAKFSFEKLAAKTAYIVTQQDEWSELSGKYFSENFQNLGGKIVGLDKLEPDATDFRSTITKIRASNAEVVFFPLAKNVSQFIKQARQQNLSQKFVTADLLNDEEIKNSQGAAEGMYNLQAAMPDSETANSLFKRFKTRYGAECELKQFVAWGHDAVLVLFSAWERAKQNGGKELADAVRKITDLEGAAGKISVTEKGSAPKYPIPYIVRDGKLAVFNN